MLDPEWGIYYRGYYSWLEMSLKVPVLRVKMSMCILCQVRHLSSQPSTGRLSDPVLGDDYQMPVSLVNTYICGTGTLARPITLSLEKTQGNWTLLHANLKPQARQTITENLYVFVQDDTLTLSIQCHAINIIYDDIHIMWFITNCVIVMSNTDK